MRVPSALLRREEPTIFAKPVVYFFSSGRIARARTASLMPDPVARLLMSFVRFTASHGQRFERKAPAGLDLKTRASRQHAGSTSAHFGVSIGRHDSEIRNWVIAAAAGLGELETPDGCTRAMCDRWRAL